MKKNENRNRVMDCDGGAPCSLSSLAAHTSFRRTTFFFKFAAMALLPQVVRSSKINCLCLASFFYLRSTL